MLLDNAASLDKLYKGMRSFQKPIIVQFIFQSRFAEKAQLLYPSHAGYFLLQTGKE